MTSSPPGRPRPGRFDWSNLRLRILSAAVLAPLAVLAVWIGGLPFLLLVWGAIGLLALEWATMSAPETPIRAAAVMAVMLLVAAVAVKAGYFKSAWLSVAIGAAVVWGVAMIWRRDDGPMHEAFGMLYLGVPMVALLWLRSGGQGRAWTLMLLAATWSADIGAYAGGQHDRRPEAVATHLAQEDLVRFPSGHRRGHRGGGGGGLRHARLWRSGDLVGLGGRSRGRLGHHGR